MNYEQMCKNCKYYEEHFADAGRCNKLSNDEAFVVVRSVDTPTICFEQKENEKEGASK